MSASRVYPCVNANTANDVVMEQLAIFSTQRSASTDLFSRNRETQTIETLRDQHAVIWPLTHAAHYAELASILGPLIAGLEAAVNADACGDQLSEVRGMLVDAYQATLAMMAELGAIDDPMILTCWSRMTGGKPSRYSSPRTPSPTSSADGGSLMTTVTRSMFGLEIFTST